MRGASDWMDVKAAWRAAAMAFVLALAGCGQEPAESASVAVAVVDGEPITAASFARSYELGFTHLKRGDDPRVTYLQRMIDEKLLALEGYRLGLDETADVQHQVASLREELLVEQLFEREVNERVVATEAEIQEAMARERVQFRLRYLPAPTLEEAQRLHATVRTLGFEAARDRLIAADAERAWHPEDFESPYLTEAEIDPALLAAVADLPVGTVSPPVRYRGSYLLLEVADVRREPVSPADAPAERERYEQLVVQRKAKAAARRFIGETMGPLDVRIKGAVFRDLRDALWTWYEDVQPVANLQRALSEAEGEAAERLRVLRPEVLFTTRDGDWTVADFLAAFPVDRYPLSRRDEDAFESDLYDAIGLTLRDRVFARRAEAEGLDAAPAVREDLARWTDKWVYRAFVRQVADTIQVTDADARAYFEQHRTRYGGGGEGDAPAFADVAERVRADAREDRLRRHIEGVLAALRERHPISIRHDVLDTLSVSDPAGRVAPDVLFFKAHSGRLAYPVVDPSW